MTMLLINVVFEQAACIMAMATSSSASNSYGSARSCELYGVDQFLRLQVCHCSMQCPGAAVAALPKKQRSGSPVQLLWERLPAPCALMGPLALCKKQIQVCPSLQKANSDTIQFDVHKQHSSCDLGQAMADTINMLWGKPSMTVWLFSPN